MAQLFQKLKIFSSDTRYILSLVNKLIVIILIIAAIKIIYHFGSILIKKFFQKQKASRFGFNDRKADTLSELLKSILKYTLYIFGILTVLDQIGFNTRALLLGAGLGGVALGFGAQSLVKDIITGFFIIFEDQFSVGEYITIGDMSGVVEAVGLRITRLKDFSGDLHIIPNGQITTVTNHSRDNARALVDVSVSYDTNMEKVLEVLKEITDSLKKDNQDIVDGPAILGVSNLGESGFSIRITARTKPTKQWGVEADIRKRVKDRFEKENIRMPVPARVIITKSGNNL